MTDLRSMWESRYSGSDEGDEPRQQPTVAELWAKRYAPPEPTLGDAVRTSLHQGMKVALPGLAAGALDTFSNYLQRDDGPDPLQGVDAAIKRRLDPVADAMRGYSERNAAESQADVENIMERGNLLEKGTFLLGQGLTSMVPTLAAGAVNPALGAATAVGMGLGDVYNTLIEQGMDPVQAAERAVAVSPVYGALERVVPTRATGQALKRLPITSVGREAVQGALSEGVTESAQQVLAQGASLGTEHFYGIDWKQVFTEGVAGALTGGVVGGAGAGIGSMRGGSPGLETPLDTQGPPQAPLAPERATTAPLAGPVAPAPTPERDNPLYDELAVEIDPLARQESRPGPEVAPAEELAAPPLVDPTTSETGRDAPGSEPLVSEQELAELDSLRQRAEGGDQAADDELRRQRTRLVGRFHGRDPEAARVEAVGLRPEDLTQEIGRLEAALGRQGIPERVQEYRRTKLAAFQAELARRETSEAGEYAALADAQLDEELDEVKVEYSRLNDAPQRVSQPVLERMEALSAEKRRREEGAGPRLEGPVVEEAPPAPPPDLMAPEETAPRSRLTGPAADQEADATFQRAVTNPEVRSWLRSTAVSAFSDIERGKTAVGQRQQLWKELERDLADLSPETRAALEAKYTTIEAGQTVLTEQAVEDIISAVPDPAPAPDRVETPEAAQEINDERELTTYITAKAAKDLGISPGSSPVEGIVAGLGKGGRIELRGSVASFGPLLKTMRDMPASGHLTAQAKRINSEITELPAAAVVEPQDEVAAFEASMERPRVQGTERKLVGRYRGEYEGLTDAELAAKYRDLLVTAARNEVDAEADERQRADRTVDDSDNVTAGMKPPGLNNAVGRRTQARARLEAVRTLMEERGIDWQAVEAGASLLEAEAQVDEANRDLLGPAGLFEIGTREEIEAEAESTIRAWNQNRDDPVLTERVGLFFEYNARAEAGLDEDVLVLEEVPEELRRALRAGHNTTLAGLKWALDMGGIPNPSLAVYADEHGFDKYGAVTLVAPRELVDPRSPGIEVYDADIYSPRTPTVMARPTKAAKEFVDRVRERQRWSVSHEGDIEDGAVDRVSVYSLARQEAVQDIFLEEQGLEAPAPVMKAPDRTNLGSRMDVSLAQRIIDAVRGPHAAWMELKAELRPRVVEAMHSVYSAAGADQDFLDEIPDIVARQWDDYSHLWNRLLEDAEDLAMGRQMVDAKATREARDAVIESAGGLEAIEEWLEAQVPGWFEDPYIEDKRGRKLPATLENMSKVMRSEGRKAAEKTMTYGPGNARAAAARQLTGVRQFEDYRGQLVDQPKMDRWKKFQTSVRERVWSELEPFYQFSSSWDLLDDMHKAASMVMLGVSPGVALQRNGFMGVDTVGLEHFEAFVASIRDSPTSYLEAKARRPVTLDEFAGVVLPDTAPTELVDQLEDRGLEVQLYPEGDAEARKAAVARMFGGVEGQRQRGTLFDDMPELLPNRTTEPRIGPLYHGTPVNDIFDRFDFKYLRSGEGATAFGEGFYFAEDFEIADKNYRERLARRGKSRRAATRRPRFNGWGQEAVLKSVAAETTENSPLKTELKQKIARQAKQHVDYRVNAIYSEAKNAIEQVLMDERDADERTKEYLRYLRSTLDYHAQAVSKQESALKMFEGRDVTLRRPDTFRPYEVYEWRPGAWQVSRGGEHVGEAKRQEVGGRVTYVAKPFGIGSIQPESRSFDTLGEVVAWFEQLGSAMPNGWAVVDTKTDEVLGHMYDAPGETLEDAQARLEERGGVPDFDDGSYDSKYSALRESAGRASLMPAKAVTLQRQIVDFLMSTNPDIPNWSEIENEGRLYTVYLRADDEEFVRYDAERLQDQPSKVLEALGVRELAEEYIELDRQREQMAADFSGDGPLKDDPRWQRIDSRLKQLDVDIAATMFEYTSEVEQRTQYGSDEPEWVVFGEHTKPASGSRDRWGIVVRPTENSDGEPGYSIWGRGTPGVRGPTHGARTLEAALEIAHTLSRRRVKDLVFGGYGARFLGGAQLAHMPREWLASKGIKGVKYADGNTRYKTGPEQKFNYVIMTDDVIEIVDVRDTPTDLFGNPIEEPEGQAEMALGSDQGVTEALNRARATVSLLQGRIDRGVATPDEELRYNEARGLIRRQEGRGLSQGEIKPQEGALDTPDDNLSLFEGIVDRLRAVPAMLTGDKSPAQVREEIAHGSPEAALEASMKAEAFVARWNGTDFDYESRLARVRKADERPKGEVHFRGLKLKESVTHRAEQIAGLFQFLRDPRTETLAVIGRDQEGRIVATEYVSSGNLNYVNLFSGTSLRRRAAAQDRRGTSESRVRREGAERYYEELADRLKRAGATTVTLVHNHPSGKPTPSEGDIKVTKGLRRYLLTEHQILLDGHVILNHDTVGLIVPSGLSSAYSGLLDIEPPPAGSPWLEESRYSVTNEAGLVDYRLALQAAQEIVNLGDDAAVAVYETKGEVVALEPVSFERAQRVRKWARQRMRAIGATRVFLVTGPEAGHIAEAGAAGTNLALAKEDGFADIIPTQRTADGQLEAIPAPFFLASPWAPRKPGYRIREDQPEVARNAGRGGDPAVAEPPAPPPPPTIEAALDELLEGDHRAREEAMRKARGLGRTTLWQKFKDGLEGARASFKQTFKYINPEESPLMARLQDRLRLYRAARALGETQAVNRIHEVVKDLEDPKHIELFERALILPDILKDIEAGLYAGGKPIPFGYQSAAEVQDHLDATMKEIGSNELITDALQKRASLNRQVKRMLVDAELLPRSVLDDDRYYHRQVLKYMEVAGFNPMDTQGSDVRLKTKGFQRQRVGGSEFNTAYHEAEMEWLSQAFTLMRARELLGQIKQDADLTNELKRKARSRNWRAAATALNELGDADFAYRMLDGQGRRMPDDEALDQWLLPYRATIAYNTQDLVRGIMEGEYAVPEKFQGDAEGWVEEYQFVEANKGDNPDLKFTVGGGPRWFEFLSAMLEEGLPGSHHAAAIFGAIRDKEAAIKELAGSAYIEWHTTSRAGLEALLKLAPEGYTLWQPQRGQHFFAAQTIEEKALDEIIAGSRALSKDEFREAMVMGGPRETWIVPEALAMQLDNWSAGDFSKLEELAQRAQTWWKQYILLNPARFVKYNLNNMSGDTDIAFAANPRILGYAKQALLDLHAMHRGEASPALLAELEDAVARGVIESGFSGFEVPDISDHHLFEHFTTNKEEVITAFLKKTGRGIRDYTTMRENLLRLAAFRFYRNVYKENPNAQVYAASKKNEVDALGTDTTAKAAKIARELIGDYGAISVAGQWIRRTAIPFWSWLEINAPRYYRMFKNLRHDELLGGTNLAAGAVARGGATVARMGAYYGLMAFAQGAFGAFGGWGDDEDEAEARQAAFNRSRRDLHLPLYRNEDGSIYSVRLEGAGFDALEWIGLGDLPQEIRDVAEGRRNFADIAADAPKAAIDKFVQGLRPDVKWGAEAIAGRSFFPSIFPNKGWQGKKTFIPGSTRPVRDRVEHFLSPFNPADRIYNRLAGRPVRDQSAFIGGLKNIAGYEADPDEVAYYEARNMVRDFRREVLGEDSASMQPTDRSNALYDYKRALRFGDEDAAEKALEKYIELGGSLRGMRQSETMADPLYGLDAGQKARFFGSLSDRDRDIVQLAQQWYRRTYQGRLSAGATPSTSR